LKRTLGIHLLVLAAAAGTPCMAASTAPAPLPSTTPSVSQTIQQNRDGLLAVLNNPQAHQDDRDEAARRLASVQDQGARRMLLRVLVNEGNPRGQLAVAKALAAEPVDDPAFVDPLFQLLGADRALSDAAATALGAFGNDPGVLNRLTALARNGQEPMIVRLATIKGIGRFVDKQAAGTLVGLLDARQPESIRQAASAALGQLTGEPFTGADQWQSWWQSVSGDSDPAFKAALVDRRAQRYDRLHIKHEQLLADLQTLLRDQYRLAGSKPDMLLRYLHSPAPIVRQIGAQLVVDDLKNAIPPAAAVKAQLRTLIGDSSADVRLQVADTFAAINDRQALEPLLAQLAQEPEARVRAALTAALTPIRDASAAPTFLKLLDDPSLDVVEAACRALREVAPTLRQQQPAMADHAAEALIHLLSARTQPGSSGLRESGIDALGALKYPPSLRPLGLMLRDVETVSVRRAALRALGQLGDIRAQDLIVQNALDDPDKDIRLAAVEALGSTATFAAAEALYRHLQPSNEPDERVRAAAWKVLEGLFPTAPKEQLALWPDRFNNQPQRQLVVLKALAGLYTSSEDADRLAFVQQNLGAVLMKLNQPADAAGYFDKALKHWIEEGNNMLTQGLIRQNIEALLRGGQYDQAVTFASQMIGRNLSDQQTMGIAIRDQAQRLADAGDKANLARLVASTQKMEPPLDSNYTSQLAAIQERVKGK
jgi:HEAT repeat protein